MIAPPAEEIKVEGETEWFTKLPEWYTKILGMLSTKQTCVFVLHGNVFDYPERPEEPLDRYLIRNIETEALARIPDYGQLENGALEEKIAKHRIAATYDMTNGLLFGSEAQREVFNDVVFPQQAVGLGGDPKNPYKDEVESPGDALKRAQQYFLKSAKPKKNLPAMSLIINRADLFLPKADPPLPDERPLIDIICEWASSGLPMWPNEPSRIFLVTPSPDKLYPYLLQGSVAQIQIPIPDYPMRKTFIDLHFAEEENPPKLEEGLTINQLAQITGSLTLRGLEDVICQSMLLEKNNKTITRKMAQDRKDELVRQQYGGVMRIDYPTLTFDDIVGLEELKDHMKGYVLEKLINKDPICPKGMILSGPPGTAKTAMAQALANAMELPLVVIAMDKIKSKYVGESNQNMAQLTEGITALAPCIVLADELDKILGSADDNTSVTQELTGALQSFLSDIPRGQCFFIATTNYPDKVPPAMRRPGRLDMLVPMFPQHLDGKRGEVLSCLARRMGLRHCIVDAQWDEIGEQAKGFSGADLELLVSEADICGTINGREIIGVGDFNLALSNIVPAVEGTQYMILSTLRLTTNRKFVPKILWPLMDRSRQEEDEEEERPSRGGRRRRTGQ